MKKPRKTGAKGFSWVSGLFLAGAVNISQNSAKFGRQWLMPEILAKQNHRNILNK